MKYLYLSSLVFGLHCDGIFKGYSPLINLHDGLSYLMDAQQKESQDRSAVRFSIFGDKVNQCGESGKQILFFLGESSKESPKCVAHSVKECCEKRVGLNLQLASQSILEAQQAQVAKQKYLALHPGMYDSRHGKCRA